MSGSLSRIGSGLLLANTGRRLSDPDDAARSCAPRRGSGGGGVRGSGLATRRRYEEDRAAIAAMLKNYSLVSLLWVVPAALVLGVLRFVYLTLGRRFEEALDIAAAWGWNVAHLPGTLSRRRRAQKVRRVRDRALRRFMESAGLRSPRWFATAERILEEQRAIEEADEGEPIQRRLRDRTASLVGSHPVIVGSFLAVIVGAVAVRELIGSEALVGGALPAFPLRWGTCSRSWPRPCDRRRSEDRSHRVPPSVPSERSRSHRSAIRNSRRRRSCSRDRPSLRS